ncbi:MAG: nucleotidyltransferase substrate binding protein [Elusimicrobiales bacterium]|nr:nucleotidyltransferase substrate binding protein [Elusimicrobiales bacterium]HOL63580.1 HI0074 family nucleotidyltransferase substrate-binding subunit [Elusimicrobiales bacterium]HPO95413.1 HI0074 family nucleotidyltransferase substrate-binding subunit [Elusimicrobiales bacterium]
MTKSEVIIAIERLKKVFQKLKEATIKAKDDLDRDGVIQRFEFTTELLWKTLKIVLEYQSIDASQGPKYVVKQAFKFGYIPDDEIILDILNDRNQTSHIYEEKTAEEIYTRISKIYVSKIEEIINHLESKV